MCREHALKRIGFKIGLISKQFPAHLNIIHLQFHSSPCHFNSNSNSNSAQKICFSQRKPSNCCLLPLVLGSLCSSISFVDTSLSPSRSWLSSSPIRNTCQRGKMVVLKTYPSVINGDKVEDGEELDTAGNDSESEQESESDDDEKDEIKLTEPSKAAINNKDGLLDKLGDFTWPDNVDWMHTLTIVIDQEQEADVNDDLAREAAFYTQAIQGTREAFSKLESKGLPYLRPFDYYAEMVKSDAHMGKVKSKLLVEKKHKEEQEERRKAREAKKISKQVQAEKLKERSKEKKENIESVKKWRKQREKSGFANDKDEMKLSFEGGGGPLGGKRKGPPGVSPGDRSGGKARQFGGKGKRGMDKNRKDRDFKNSKFGFGGRKGGKKQNTADTTNDIRGFNNKNNSRSGNKKRKVG